MKSNRQLRVRRHIRQVSTRPRLSVTRSLKNIWVQLIDDKKGIVICATSDKALKLKGTKTEKATKVGSEIAKLAINAKVKQVVFDRGAYRYHGRVKALAEAARAGGLDF